jgi:hypothetical protein
MIGLEEKSSVMLLKACSLGPEGTACPSPEGFTDSEPPPGCVFQRQAVIKARVKTLSKMKRRNAMMIGPPVTWKSATGYELARRISHDDLSIELRSSELDTFDLSAASLSSARQGFGEYDGRGTNLLKFSLRIPTSSFSSMRFTRCSRAEFMKGSRFRCGIGPQEFRSDL